MAFLKSNQLFTDHGIANPKTALKVVEIENSGTPKWAILSDDMGYVLAQCFISTDDLVVGAVLMLENFGTVSAEKNILVLRPTTSVTRIKIKLEDPPVSVKHVSLEELSHTKIETPMNVKRCLESLKTSPEKKAKFGSNTGMVSQIRNANAVRINGQSVQIRNIQLSEGSTSISLGLFRNLAAQNLKLGQIVQVSNVSAKLNNAGDDNNGFANFSTGSNSVITDLGIDITAGKAFQDAESAEFRVYAVNSCDVYPACDNVNCNRKKLQDSETGGLKCPSCASSVGAPALGVIANILITEGNDKEFTNKTIFARSLEKILPNGLGAYDASLDQGKQIRAAIYDAIPEIGYMKIRGYTTGQDKRILEISDRLLEPKANIGIVAGNSGLKLGDSVEKCDKHKEKPQGEQILGTSAATANNQGKAPPAP